MIDDSFFPELTCYDDAVWRLIRLSRVCGYLFAINQLENITRLHDHKGVLIVCWNRQPNSKQMSATVDAWLKVGDYSDNVEHVIHHPEIPPLEVEV